jgi:hypothetical protein
VRLKREASAAHGQESAVPPAHYPSGIEPVGLRSHWTLTNGGSRRNALPPAFAGAEGFSALRLLSS